MRYTNAFLARYAGLGAGGPWAADSFVGWWICARFPEQAQLAVVWACEFESAELGKPARFDFSLVPPSGSSQLILQAEGVPAQSPSMPAAVPYFWETWAFNFTVEFQVQGLHQFEIRSDDGATCATPLYVHGA